MKARDAVARACRNEWVRGSEVAVLWALAYAIDSGLTNPTSKQIQTLSGLSKSAVFRVLRVLRLAGLLVVKSRSYADGGHAPNTYQIDGEWLPARCSHVLPCD